MADTKYAIEVAGLKKSYGKLNVLKGVSFNVRHGTILALLGPNGAGKTTIIKILSTLLLPDAGTLNIAGYNVVKQSDKVRSAIGLTGQYAAVDEYLTGEENLLMIGRLYRLTRAGTKARTHELLKVFDLVDAAKRPVKTYSGGMRRRLDLAMSLIASPDIIFLDEPTTGLDPRSRQTMWELIKQLASQGTTILLTTQYMEEADQLADNVVVIDQGKVIAEGTTEDLKSKVGSDRLEIVIGKKSNPEAAFKVLGDKKAKLDAEARTLSVASRGGTGKLRQTLEKLEQGRIDIESFSLHRPTLDDVFLTLTGRTTDSKQTAPEQSKTHMRSKHD